MPVGCKARIDGTIIEAQANYAPAVKESLSALSKLMWNAFYAYTAPARAPYRQIKRTLPGRAESFKKPAYTRGHSPRPINPKRDPTPQITPP